MHQETSFVSLLIVVALAAVVPVITTQMRRLRIPIVVGEIIAGIIVGTSGLNLVGSDPWLEMLSTLGFAYLMFLSGLEVDFDAVVEQMTRMEGAWKERLRSPLLLAVLSFLLTLTLALLASLGLCAAGLVQDPVLMALILSTTSLGLVVPILKERGELRSTYGQTLLLASLVADFATMFLISVYVIFHTSGLTLEMLLVLVLLGAFVSLYRILLRLRRHPPLERLFWRVSEAASHMPVRAAFAIGLAFIALAERLGVEAILGAFLGGALIALLSQDDESRLQEELDAMGYNFFIPIFFIMVGVRFDLRALLSSTETLLLLPLLLGIAYLIKLLPGLVFRLVFTWRRTLGAGLILSSRLSLIIAAAAIGLDLGAISVSVNSDIILLAIVTCTLSPLLFNRLVPPAVKAEPAPVIVVGEDQDAVDLSHRLKRHDERIILMMPAALADQFEVPQGVDRVALAEIEREALKAAGIGGARTLVALLGDDVLNLRLCQLATASFRIPNVVAQVNDPANVEAYAAAGAHPVTLDQARMAVLENLVQTPNVFGLLSHLDPGQEIVEMAIENPDLNGVPVHALRLPGRSVLMIIRRGETFIPPRGDTRLSLGDMVTVLASQEEVDQVCQVFACAQLPSRSQKES